MPGRRERASLEGTPTHGRRRRERATRSDHLRRLRESWPAFLQGRLRSQHPAAAADAPAGRIGCPRSGARPSRLLQGGQNCSGAVPARSLRSPHAIRPLRLRAWGDAQAGRPGGSALRSPGAGRAGLAREGTLAEHAGEEASARRARGQRARRQPEPRQGPVARRRRPIERGDPCRRAPHFRPRRAPRPARNRPRAQAACRSVTALRPPPPPGGKARRTAGLRPGSSTPAGPAGRSRIANARLAARRQQRTEHPLGRGRTPGRRLPLRGAGRRRAVSAGRARPVQRACAGAGCAGAGGGGRSERVPSAQSIRLTWPGA
jgi:hypothetical protein